MISVDILDDDAFANNPVKYGWVKSFVLRMVTYLMTNTPPKDGFYTRSPATRHPGISIRICSYVSLNHSSLT